MSFSVPQGSGVNQNSGFGMMSLQQPKPLGVPIYRCQIQGHINQNLELINLSQNQKQGLICDLCAQSRPNDQIMYLTQFLEIFKEEITSNNLIDNVQQDQYDLLAIQQDSQKQLIDFQMYLKHQLQQSVAIIERVYNNQISIINDLKLREDRNESILNQVSSGNSNNLSEFEQMIKILVNEIDFDSNKTLFFKTTQHINQVQNMIQQTSKARDNIQSEIIQIQSDLSSYLQQIIRYITGTDFEQRSLFNSSPPKDNSPSNLISPSRSATNFPSSQSMISSPPKSNSEIVSRNPIKSEILPRVGGEGGFSEVNFVTSSPKEQTTIKHQFTSSKTILPIFSVKQNETQAEALRSNPQPLQSQPPLLPRQINQRQSDSIHDVHPMNVSMFETASFRDRNQYRFNDQRNGSRKIFQSSNQPNTNFFRNQPIETFQRVPVYDKLTYHTDIYENQIQIDLPSNSKNGSPNSSILKQEFDDVRRELIEDNTIIKNNIKMQKLFDNNYPPNYNYQSLQYTPQSPTETKFNFDQRINNFVTLSSERQQYINGSPNPRDLLNYSQFSPRSPINEDKGSFFINDTEAKRPMFNLDAKQKYNQQFKIQGQIQSPAAYFEQGKQFNFPGSRNGSNTTTPRNQNQNNNSFSSIKGDNQLNGIRTSNRICWQAHDTPLLDVELIDKDQLASVTDDGNIYFWDKQQGQLIGIVEAHTVPIRKIKYNRFSRILITLGDDFKIKAWQSNPDWRCICQLRGHNQTISGICFQSERCLISGSVDGKICVWDLEKGNLVDHFYCDDSNGSIKSAISCIKVISQKLLLIVVDRSLIVWNISKTGRLSQKPQKPIIFEKDFSSTIMNVASITQQNNETNFVTAENQGILKFWDTNTLSVVKTIDLRQLIQYICPLSELDAIAFISEERQEEHINVIDVHSQKEIQIFNPNRAQPNKLIWDPSLKIVISTHSNNFIQFNKV